ncbi:MAG: hypothetical protein FJ104_16525 [Deltaproteobacteria bacterium]|nr:hypothetical protein [Deltaproteobacteria bacterium]
MAGWLEERGQSSIEVDRTFDMVWFVGTWGDVNEVVTFRGVQGFELRCSPSTCAYCADLPQEQCAADSFCAPVSGSWANAETGCWSYGYAGCVPFPIACPEFDSYAMAADGTCWRLDGCGVEALTRIDGPFAPDSPCSITTACTAKP